MCVIQRPLGVCVCVCFSRISALFKVETWYLIPEVPGGDPKTSRLAAFLQVFHERPPEVDLPAGGDMKHGMQLTIQITQQVSYHICIYDVL